MTRAAVNREERLGVSSCIRLLCAVHAPVWCCSAARERHASWETLLPLCQLVANGGSPPDLVRLLD